MTFAVGESSSVPAATAPPRTQTVALRDSSSRLANTSGVARSLLVPLNTFLYEDNRNDLMDRLAAMPRAQQQEQSVAVMQSLVELHDTGLEALTVFHQLGVEEGRLPHLTKSKRNPNYRMTWTRVNQVLRSRPAMYRQDEARRAIKERWGERVEDALHLQDASRNMLDALRQVAIKIPRYKKANTAIHHIIRQRAIAGDDRILRATPKDLSMLAALAQRENTAADYTMPVLRAADLRIFNFRPGNFELIPIDQPAPDIYVQSPPRVQDVTIDDGDDDEDDDDDDDDEDGEDSDGDGDESDDDDNDGGNHQSDASSDLSEPIPTTSPGGTVHDGDRDIPIPTTQPPSSPPPQPSTPPPPPSASDMHPQTPERQTGTRQGTPGTVRISTGLRFRPRSVTPAPASSQDADDEMEMHVSKFFDAFPHIRSQMSWTLAGHLRAPFLPFLPSNFVSIAQDEYYMFRYYNRNHSEYLAYSAFSLSAQIVRQCPFIYLLFFLTHPQHHKQYVSFPLCGMNTPVDPSATLYMDTDLSENDDHRVHTTPRCLVDIFDEPNARSFTSDAFESSVKPGSLVDELPTFNSKKKLKDQSQPQRQYYAAAAGTAFLMSTTLPVAAPDRLQNPVFALEPCLLPIEDGNVLDFPLSVDDIASMHRAIALNKSFSQPVNRSTSAAERAAEYRLPTLV